MSLTMLWDECDGIGNRGLPSQGKRRVCSLIGDCGHLDGLPFEEREDYIAARCKGDFGNCPYSPDKSH